MTAQKYIDDRGLFHVFETRGRLITKCILAKLLVRQLPGLPGLFLRPCCMSPLFCTILTYIVPTLSFWECYSDRYRIPNLNLAPIKLKSSPVDTCWAVSVFISPIFPSASFMLLFLCTHFIAVLSQKYIYYTTAFTLQCSTNSIKIIKTYNVQKMLVGVTSWT